MACERLSLYNQKVKAGPGVRPCVSVSKLACRVCALLLVHPPPARARGLRPPAPSAKGCWSSRSCSTDGFESLAG